MTDPLEYHRCVHCPKGAICDNMPMPFGKYRGRVIGYSLGWDWSYRKWLTEYEGELRDKYPEVFLWLEDHPPLPCPGTFDGQPCTRTPQGGDFCWAHKTASMNEEPLDLRSCRATKKSDGTPCRNRAKDDSDYCWIHRLHGNEAAEPLSPWPSRTLEEELEDPFARDYAVGVDLEADLYRRIDNRLPIDWRFYLDPVKFPRLCHCQRRSPLNTKYCGCGEDLRPWES